MDAPEAPLDAPLPDTVPDAAGLEEGTPPSPSTLENDERFLLDLEFVQALANIDYLKCAWQGGRPK